MSKRINAIVYKFGSIFKKYGIKGLLLQAIYELSSKKLRNRDVYIELAKGKCCLEIGGPTKIFEAKGLLPIYPAIKSLDICNISKTNDKVKYVCDAVDLKMIKSKTYDLVLASHTIEHIANPIKALSEWLRVLKDDGVLLLVIPHKDGTIDNKRPVTSLSHLLDDYNNGVTEDDRTHLKEILSLTDYSLNVVCSDAALFRQKVIDHFNERYVHMHVFNTILATQLFDHFNLQILSVDIIPPLLPFHIIIAGKKMAGGRADNTKFIMFRQ